MGPAGDIDGDGAMDFLAGTNPSAPLPSFIRLYLFSGRTGGLLEAYELLRGGDSFEFRSLGPLGDVDGDGTPEFLASSPGSISGSSAESGVAFVVRYEHEKPAFFRGDANQDGRLNLTDAVEILHALWGHRPLGPCPAAFDTDRDEELTLRDAVEIIFYLFLDDFPSPAAPFGECGRYGVRNPTPFWGEQPLPCSEFAACP